MSEPKIPERMCGCECHDEGEPWCDLCFDVFPHYTSIIKDLQAKVAEQAEEIEKLQFALDMTGVLLLRKQVAEQAATIAEQKTDLILSAAMLLRRLKLEPQLREIRTECFDDSHWAQMIDAALSKQEAK